MKKIYEVGKVYGDYTLLARENYLTISGKNSQRLKCLNNKTGKIVYLRASGLKNHIKHIEKIQENFNKG